MIQVKEAVNDVITLQQTVYSQEEFTEKLEKMNIFMTDLSNDSVFLM